MSDFDSFDALTSEDPKDGALPITIPSAGITLPWRVDALAAERLRDRHGIPFADVLDVVDDMLGGVDQELLDEYGIESSEDYQALSEKKRQEIADSADHADIDTTMSAAARLLHAGFVRFEPGLEYEEVLGAVTFGDLQSLPISQMAQRMVPSDDETAPDVDSRQGEDGDEGK